MPKIEYIEVGKRYWVVPGVGYVQAVRLSPSGSGEPYKGKGPSEGYLVLGTNDDGEAVVNEEYVFLSLEEVFLTLEELAIKQQESLEALVKDLPYKKIVDLTPIVKVEIQNATNQFGWADSDDLTVEVTLEENLELVVRIGKA